MPKKVNWLIEDNVVAMYLAMCGDSELSCNTTEITEIIANTVAIKKGFLMRIQNYRFIVTDGKEGLDAGYPDGYKKYKDLYNLFSTYQKDSFRDYVNMIISLRDQFPRVTE